MQHRLQVVLNLAALTSVVVFAACSSDANKPDEISNVRVLNASMSTGPITANTEGRTISSNVAFQTSTLSGACGTIEKGGDEQIDFVAAGTTNGLGSVKANFVPRQFVLPTARPFPAYTSEFALSRRVSCPEFSRLRRRKDDIAIKR